MKIIKILKFAAISLIILSILLIFNPSLAIDKVDLSEAQRAQTDPIDLSRSTWDTGWFQTEIVKQLLEELGYQVSTPKTKDNLDFYNQVAKGNTDLWVNGWFPNQNQLLNLEEISNKVLTVGNLVEGGAKQGYLIDRKSAERLNIKNIEDLKDPATAKEFDRNNNGKADLIGCNKDWVCADLIDYQIEKYGLKDTVEQIKSNNYNANIKETISDYNRGKPILFYTWTPNWTIDALKPGQDLVWLEVPFTALPTQDNTSEKSIVTTKIEGCQSDPCQLGFPVNDIKAVANRKFLEDRPDVKKLLELTKIPLEDINKYNARMYRGEDSEQDIQIHAKEWIENNRGRVNLWLKLARDEQITQTNQLKNPPSQIIPNIQTSPTLKVVTKRFEPFVMYQDSRYIGFSIDLWKQLAREINVNYEIYGVNSIAKLLDLVNRNATDLAIAGITITAQREKNLDFSHPFYETGLQIMVANHSRSMLETIASSIESILTSRNLYYALGIFILILTAVAHLVWLFERNFNPEFSPNYLKGIWEALWWVAVTLTTVGYGDKTPKSHKGRLVGLFWMFAGYFVFAYFTATITTTFALDQLEGRIKGLEDLDRVKVGTVNQSAAQEFLEQENIYSIQYDSLEETYLALQDRKIDAIVYDAGALQYYALNEGRGSVQLVDSIFKKQYYGIALPSNSPYRNKLNIALLKIKENGSYDKIYRKWFAKENTR